MKFSVITTKNARRDIQQAIDWENERSVGLGERFLDYLKEKVEVLVLMPYIGSIRVDNIRCASVDVFQYLIYYIVDGEAKTVTITRVLHVRRKPIL